MFEILSNCTEINGYFGNDNGFLLLFLCKVMIMVEHGLNSPFLRIHLDLFDRNCLIRLVLLQLNVIATSEILILYVDVNGLGRSTQILLLFALLSKQIHL